MNEMDYKSNSHKARKEQAELPEKKVEKVVTGAVRTKKRSGVNKLADIFIPGDVHNVKSYVFMDVLVPAIKDAIEDIVTNGIRMILRGETTARKKTGSSSYISYDRFSDKRDSGRTTTDAATRAKTGFTYDDIIFESRGEAEEVLSRMDELIETYNQVTVADLYDLAGISCDYTYQKYGWTNINTAEPVRVGSGYIIKFPRVTPLKS